MTYNLGIPAASNTPAHDQPLMQQNFTQIAQSYNTDHIPLSSGSNAGYSNKLTLVTQGSAPSQVATGGVEFSLVPTNYTTVHTELFYEGESGTGTVQQITNQSLTASSGQGMLPGGLQIRTGFYTGASPISFTAFPTAIISILLTSYATGTQFDVTGSPSKSGFSFSPAIPGGAGLYYLAIGY